MQKLLPLFALSLAVAGSALGVTYTDNFSTNPGALNGRTTAAGFGNWISGTDLSTGVGTGIYESGSARYPTAAFQLPTMDTSSSISLSVTLKATGSANNLVAFGFTNSATDFVTSQGSALVYLSGAGSGSDGLVAVSGGYSTQGNNVYFANPFSSFNGTLSTTITMDYVIASGLMTVSATNNGQTVQLFNGITGWNPTPPGSVPNTPVPYMTYLNYFTIQFEDQTTGALGGNISNLTVSVVPEPSASAYIIGAVAAFGVVALIRRRRAALIG